MTGNFGVGDTKMMLPLVNATALKASPLDEFKMYSVKNG
jgi:hypothetical protein